MIYSSILVAFRRKIDNMNNPYNIKVKALLMLQLLTSRFIFLSSYMPVFRLSCYLRLKGLFSFNEH